jgi:hypothetical protein
MGSKGSGTGNQQTTTQASAPPPQVLANYQGLVNRATSVANTPYTPYPGEQVAPLSNQTLTGLGQVGQAAQAAQPYYTQAGQETQAAMAGPTAASIGQYENPFTTDVVNATQAEFQNQNEQQAQFLNSQNIGAGAFGGDRAGVSQAILAGQQDLSEAPTIAGLNQTNYEQALAEFNNQQQTQLAGAAQTAGIGAGLQTAGLQGATADVSAGMVPQTEQQAIDTALQSDWTQGQAYPFQTTGFLGNVIEGIGSASGGTSSTSAPGPSSLSQDLGLGIAGLGALGSPGVSTALSGLFGLSDIRAKENLEPVGKTFDDQTIYKFNFKGDPRTQIGLSAQEVERRHPSAVGEGFGGLKYVDYDAATREAERAGFQSGGGLGGVSPTGTPYDVGSGHFSPAGALAMMGVPGAGAGSGRQGAGSLYYSPAGTLFGQGQRAPTISSGSSPSPLTPYPAINYGRLPYQGGGATPTFGNATTAPDLGFIDYATPMAIAQGWGSPNPVSGVPNILFSAASGGSGASGGAGGVGGQSFGNDVITPSQPNLAGAPPGTTFAPIDYQHPANDFQTAGAENSLAGLIARPGIETPATQTAPHARGGRIGRQEGGGLDDPRYSYYTPTTGNARGAAYHPAIPAPAAAPAPLPPSRPIYTPRHSAPAARAPLPAHVPYPPPRPAPAPVAQAPAPPPRPTVSVSRPDAPMPLPALNPDETRDPSIRWPDQTYPRPQANAQPQMTLPTLNPNDTPNPGRFPTGIDLNRFRIGSGMMFNPIAGYPERPAAADDQIAGSWGDEDRPSFNSGGVMGQMPLVGATGYTPQGHGVTGRDSQGQGAGFGGLFDAGSKSAREGFQGGGLASLGAYGQMPTVQPIPSAMSLVNLAPLTAAGSSIPKGATPSQSQAMSLNDMLKSSDQLSKAIGQIGKNMASSASGPSSADFATLDDVSTTGGADTFSNISDTAFDDSGSYGLGGIVRSRFQDGGTADDGTSDAGGSATMGTTTGYGPGLGIGADNSVGPSGVAGTGGTPGVGGYSVGPSGSGGFGGGTTGGGGGTAAGGSGTTAGPGGLAAAIGNAFGIGSAHAGAITAQQAEAALSPAQQQALAQMRAFGGTPSAFGSGFGTGTHSPQGQANAAAAQSDTAVRDSLQALGAGVAPGYGFATVKGNDPGLAASNTGQNAFATLGPGGPGGIGSDAVAGGPGGAPGLSVGPGGIGSDAVAEGQGLGNPTVIQALKDQIANRGGTPTPSPAGPAVAGGYGGGSPSQQGPTFGPAYSPSVAPTEGYANQGYGGGETQGPPTAPTVVANPGSPAPGAPPATASATGPPTAPAPRGVVTAQTAEAAMSPAQQQALAQQRGGGEWLRPFGSATGGRIAYGLGGITRSGFDEGGSAPMLGAGPPAPPTPAPVPAPAPIVIPSSATAAAPAAASKFDASAFPTNRAETTPAQRDAFNRAYAKSIGLDPNRASGVTRAEGLNAPGAGPSTVDVENGKPFSFGDFQLNTKAGMGVDAEKAGIDPRDPNQWQKANMFAMDQMKKGGLGPWKGDAYVKGQGGGGGGGGSGGGGSGGSALAYAGGPDQNGQQQQQMNAAIEDAARPPDRKLMSPDLSQTLMAVGFSIMGGTSPNAMTNIGQGAMQGMQYMQKQRELDREWQKNEAQIQDYQSQAKYRDAQTNLATQNLSLEMYKAKLGAYGVQYQTWLAGGGKGDPPQMPTLPGAVSAPSTSAPSAPSTAPSVKSPVAAGPKVPIGPGAVSPTVTSTTSAGPTGKPASAPPAAAPTTAAPTATTPPSAAPDASAAPPGAPGPDDPFWKDKQWSENPYELVRRGQLYLASPDETTRKQGASFIEQAHKIWEGGMAGGVQIPGVAQEKASTESQIAYGKGMGEDAAKTDAALPQKMQARQVVNDRLEEIKGLMQSYQPGAFAEEKAELAAKAASIFGIDAVPQQYLQNATSFQRFLKDQILNTMDNVKAMGGRPMVTEIESLKRAMAGPELQPGAAAAIIAQAQGIIKYQDDHDNAYSDWRENNPTEYRTTKFEKQFIKDHNIKDYITTARHNFPYQGQTVPSDASQREKGQAYMTPKGPRVWSGTGWGAFQPAAQ